MSNKVGNIKAAQRLKRTAAELGQNSNGQRPSIIGLWATASSALVGNTSSYFNDFICQQLVINHKFVKVFMISMRVIIMVESQITELIFLPCATGSLCDWSFLIINDVTLTFTHTCLGHRPLLMTPFYVKIIKVWVITFIFFAKSRKLRKVVWERR